MPPLELLQIPSPPSVVDKKENAITQEKLAKVEASLEKIEQMVTRQKGESAEAFKKRLGDLTKRVEHRRAANVSILKSGKIPLEREKHQKESPEEESRKNTAAGIDARKGGTKTYNRQTGKME